VGLALRLFWQVGPRRRLQPESVANLAADLASRLEGSRFSGLYRQTALNHFFGGKLFIVF